MALKDVALSSGRCVKSLDVAEYAVGCEMMWVACICFSIHWDLCFLSACTSASLEPSYVLRAIGADEDLAHSSIRCISRHFSIHLISEELIVK